MSAPLARITPLRAVLWVVLLSFVAFAAWTSVNRHRQQGQDADNISEAYAFAIANGQVTSELPCSCGCKDRGHASLDMCFVSRRDKSGRMIARDAHAETCPICIDVALLAGRLHTKGATPAQIRQAAEQQYGPGAATSSAHDR